MSDARRIRMINFQTQQVKTIGGDGRYELRYKSSETSFYFEMKLLTLTHPSFYTKTRDGIGLDSSFQYPYQMVMDSKGFIYLVDQIAVRRIDPEFKVTTIARIEGNFQKKQILILILTQEKNRIKLSWNRIRRRKQDDLCLRFH